jgi:hypothetical protein
MTRTPAAWTWSAFRDTLSLITWLAAKTQNVHLFPNVAKPPVAVAGDARQTGRPRWVETLRTLHMAVVPAVRESLAR